MIAFTVPGEPATKGSFRAFQARGRVVVKNDNSRCKGWQESVATVARFAMKGRKPTRRAVRVDVTFRCAWEGEGAPSGVPFLDLDKLQRALFDGLSGVAFEDDANVIEVHARKGWGEPGADVTVTEVSP